MMGVRALAWAVLWLFAILNVGVLGFKSDGRDLSLEDIPSCGLSCLLVTIPNSGCGFLETECQCKNKELAKDLSACMLANCTMAETLDSTKVQASLCSLPVESKSREILLYMSIGYAVCVVFVALRVAGKLVAGRVSPDDYVLIGTLLFTAVPVACVIVMTQNGFGLHLWDLEHGQLRRNLQLFYIAWSTYILILAMIKISLLIFYLQIFVDRSFRLACYIIATIVTINTLVIFFLTVFNCVPVSSFWNRDRPGKCIDITVLAFANSGCAIVQDMIILILPLTRVRGLKMQTGKKIAVGAMFCVGGFGWLTTLLRLQSLLTFRETIDPTWDYAPITIWTILEITSGFVCVSLPPIRFLVTSLVPEGWANWAKNGSQSRSRDRSAPTPTPLDAGREKQNGRAWGLHRLSEGLGLSESGAATPASKWPGGRTHSQGHERLPSFSDDTTRDSISRAGDMEAAHTVEYRWDIKSGSRTVQYTTSDEMEMTDNQSWRDRSRNHSVAGDGKR